LISRQLQPKGIQSRISRKGNALHILLEATQAPEKSILEPFIQKGLLNIKPTSVAEVHLYGKSTQKKMPEWKSHFTIDQPPQTNIETLNKAKAGDSIAITAIMTDLIQLKGVSVSTEIRDGDLDIILDSNQVLQGKISDIISKEIINLNINNVYDLRIYGRLAGQPFASWCRKYKIKPKPFKPIEVSSDKQEKVSGNNGTIIINLGTGEDSKNLDIVQILGFLGAAILATGIFCPMVSLPIVGTLNYFRGGHGEAISLIIFTAFSIYFLAKKSYSWLYGPAIWSFALIGITFFYYQSEISNIKAATDRELAGNPFRGLADVAMASLRLEWGWLLLFTGSVLIICTAYIKKRHLDRKSLVSIGSSFAIFLVIVFSVSSVEFVANYGQANQARESEARTRIGAINRSQQAHLLEHDIFSGNMEDLFLGLSAETENYEYEIVITESDIAVSTATPKKRGLKSFTGGVFVIQSDELETTTTITCQSNQASKKAPSIPVVSEDGTPECASGSSKI